MCSTILEQQPRYHGNLLTGTMSVAKITCGFVNFDVIVPLIKSLFYLQGHAKVTLQRK